MTDVADEFEAVLGRTQSAEDRVTAQAVATMAAALGREEIDLSDGAAVPPLWHGLFCVARLPPGRLGLDGLPAGTSILPDIEGFPRRLFGGARYRFSDPLRIGRDVQKASEVVAIERKSARSGEMIVATVRHLFVQDGTLATEEENDILFLPPAGDAGAAKPVSTAPPQSTSPHQPGTAVDADLSRTVDPDSVLLFRHSAALFNSHRIHYDRDYTRAQGLPGLVVQGTLIARLMLELLHDARPDRHMAAFRFRSGAPVYDTGPFRITGTFSETAKEVDMIATGAEGQRAMTASAELSPPA